MGVWSRIWLDIKIKTHATLDQSEQSELALTHSYRQLQELMQQVKQGIIVTTTQTLAPIFIKSSPLITRANVALRPIPSAPRLLGVRR